tara:strand:- start:1312 stop:1449 length:138 start_codon:yes stop_codon:yes gene_type:complete
VENASNGQQQWEWQQRISGVNLIAARAALAAIAAIKRARPFIHLH